MRLADKLQQLRFSLSYYLKTKRGRRSVLAHLDDPGHQPLPMPVFVQLRVTNLCNLRCRMCGQWGDTGVFRADSGEARAGELDAAGLREKVGLERQLSLAQYEELLDEIAPFDPIVTLFGGEPTLYPDIVPLVRAVKQRGLTLTMITNGSLLSRFAEPLVDAGIDAIAVSFDGPPALHDRIRGLPGSFARTAAGVRALAEARSARKRALPVLFAIFPITELNIGEASAAVSALSELPLDAVNVGLRWFVPSEAGADYERVMRESFGVSGDSWKGFQFSWPGGEASARSQLMLDLVRYLKVLRRKRLTSLAGGTPWVSFLPDIRPEDVPTYLTNHGETFGHDLCPVAWFFAQIQPDGDVAFCGDFPDYVIGSVRSQTFRDIWSGPKAMAFRERLAREPLPICSRCCGSFVYGRWKRRQAPVTASLPSA